MGATCAQDCAKKGNQVALVTKEGEVYDVTGALAEDKNAKLVAHMSHTVTLTGEVTGAKEKLAIAATDLKMVSR